MHKELQDYKIVVFGAENPEVFHFQKSKDLDIQVLGLMEYEDLIQLLCTSSIYIGNSNSDGMPNTLLEAICAGSFLLQSNPGGATAELIENNKNGLLIENCEDVSHIKVQIKNAITNKQLLQNAVDFNTSKVVPRLSRQVVQDQVIKAYNSLGNEINRFN
ncbi:hypothetical protein JCM19298_1887 [Nonlabens ulvanivorans]|nr:glycosyltransferase [Nonlabens ulvanivorans]GAK93168.1 hypothetical protein JCM19298_1887 [Nonlabens ulvanivorans]